MWRVVAFSVALVVSGALTLGIKAASGHYAVGVDQVRLITEIRRALEHDGFATRVQRFAVQQPMVIGTRSACIVAVRDASQADSLDTVFSQQSASIGRIEYYVDGQVRAGLPIFRIELGNAIQRWMSRLGVNHGRAAPLAIAVGGRCRDVPDLSSVRVFFHHL